MCCFQCASCGDEVLSWRCRRVIKCATSNNRRVCAFICKVHIMTTHFGPLSCSHDSKGMQAYISPTNSRKCVAVTKTSHETRQPFCKLPAPGAPLSSSSLPYMFFYRRFLFMLPLCLCMCVPHSRKSALGSCPPQSHSHVLLNGPINALGCKPKLG